MEPPPFDIFINGRFLEQPLTGVQRYGREMLAALDRLLDSEDIGGERWWLVTTGRERDSPPLRRIALRVVGSALSGHAWEQIALAGAARGGALVSLAGSGPFLHRRQLVVIHDALVFRHPESYSAIYALWRRSLSRALAATSRIGTVSQFSRGELAELLHLDLGKIPVFYNGCEHFEGRAPAGDGTVASLGLGGNPYFVLLGSLAPHKNLALAAQALADVPHASLVVIGGLAKRVFGNAPIELSGGRALFTGRLEDAEVRALLAGAAALVFPSLYEGFGLPPLEAMSLGCPVIASDIPAVREVCGDAAVYFDPRDSRQLTSAMTAALSEAPAIREERVRRGMERAHLFSWDRSARDLAQFCRRELVTVSTRRT